MDGGSGLNLMYLNTFEGLRLTCDQLQSSPHPFYGVVLGKQYVPLGWVTLSFTFGDVINYRTETLTLEVVDFSRPYHIILGQSCYVKFMDIPSYAYLKLKIPGPTEVITVEAKTQHALDCEQDGIELAFAMVVMTELRELSLWIPAALLSPAMPPTSIIFKVYEDAKDAQIDAKDPAKTVQFGASLDPK
jgi:hypothetical protein